MAEKSSQKIVISTYRCTEEEEEWTRQFQEFESAEYQPIHLPLSGSEQKFDILVTGSLLEYPLNLLATLSDWNRPPVTIYIVPDTVSAEEWQQLETHPRIGRSVFFAPCDRGKLETVLAEAYQFHCRRGSCYLSDATACPYTGDQISPRWLFEAMMTHLDEYLYFKDEKSRFLAVSQYLVERVKKEKPSEVIGADDSSFFDEGHARDAFSDEMKLIEGTWKEIHKDEPILRDGEERWVTSRKFPLQTRSGFLAGTFGISRDITESKRLRMAMEKSNEQMLAELDLARNLQSTLLDQSLSNIDKHEEGAPFTLVTRYLPSFHLSGDYYSIRKTPDGNLGILIADVMGHGVRSAMVTAMIQIALEPLRKKADDPSAFISGLNNVLKRSINASKQTLFSTALYGTLNLESGVFSFVQAGARHGMLSRNGGDDSLDPFQAEETSPALGLFEDAEFTISRITLQPGDTLLLYTDGITEATNPAGEELGEIRLRDLISQNLASNLPNKIEEILTTLHSHVGGQKLQDDICLIGIEASNESRIS